MTRKATAFLIGILGKATSSYILFGLNYKFASVDSNGVRTSGVVPAYKMGDPAIFFWAGFVLVVATLAAVAVFKGWRVFAWVSAALLIALSIVGIFSIGLFIAPLAVVTLFAAVTTRRPDGNP